MSTTIRTLGELKKSGWKSQSVKDELRTNLIRKLKSGEDIFPGILGYDKTVIPQLQNAILSRHDLLLLGLRGQAKTRILRSLVYLLDDEIPIIDGSQVHDNPLAPITKFGRERVAQMGDDTPVRWIGRDARYGEKLATPDTTVADLIGDIDPIKAARERLTLADQEVINFGLIPRTNRGIFVINELPDLQPRIQVALLNIMQERDIQIRGFNVRIPLDLFVAFSANPDDYTNRGNIITPLKDRIDSQIITHYPKQTDIAVEITRQEAWADRASDVSVSIPELYRTVIEEVAFEARKSDYIDQKSGVSTRLSITAMEQAVSSAENRAIRNGEAETTLRMTDLFHMVPALTGKLELVYEGEQEGAVSVAKHLLGKAILNVFKARFPDPRPPSEEVKSPYKGILDWFNQGNTLHVKGDASNEAYQKSLRAVQKLESIAENLRNDNDLLAVMDFLVEALHQKSMIGKEEMDDETLYSDMLGSMLGGMDAFESGEDDIS
ncbi:MAG: magnesium chelatase [Balneolaceae bacterium]